MRRDWEFYQTEQGDDDTTSLYTQPKPSATQLLSRAKQEAPESEPSNKNLLVPLCKRSDSTSVVKVGSSGDSKSKTLAKKKRKPITLENSIATEDFWKTHLAKENITIPLQVKRRKLETSIVCFEHQLNILKSMNISISTMTVNCNLGGGTVLLENFGKYVPMTVDGVYAVRYTRPKKTLENGKVRNVKIICRSIEVDVVDVLDSMKEALARKKKRNLFYNQDALLMVPSPEPVNEGDDPLLQGNPDSGPIDVKFFNNTSIHATGVKRIADLYAIDMKLISILKHPPRKDKPFMLDTSKLTICDIKIRMINTNYHVGYANNIYLLVELLNKRHKYGTATYIDWKWKPAIGHCCINIKYTNKDGNNTSIFVFQTGSTIITGCQTIEHVANGKILTDKIFNLYEKMIKIPKLDWDVVRKVGMRFVRQIKKRDGSGAGGGNRKHHST